MIPLLILLAMLAGIAYLMVAAFNWSMARETLSDLRKYSSGNRYTSPSDEEVAHALWITRGGAFAWPLTAMQKLREDRAEAEELLRRKR